jgi:uncharacterized membrane protein
MRSVIRGDHPAQARVNQPVFRTTPGNAGRRTRTTVAVGILVAVALVHVLRVGTYLSGSLFTLYYAYCSDVIVPFGLYFLLCLNDGRVPLLGDWRVKSLLVFGVAATTEVMQAFGVPLLGRTFDPLDFAMFAAGVLLAAVVDRVLLTRRLPRWSPKATRPSA